MDFRFKPVVEWIGEPTPYYKRQKARFDSTYKQTLSLLERELNQLRATQVIIQTYHQESDIRLDGLPKASARVPTNPGVILSFQSKFGPLSYPCDTFTHYEDNIRAIALALEALRKVDRYGVTKTGEQYRGWKALPAADSKSLEVAAAEFIGLHGDAVPYDVLVIKPTYAIAYNRAVRKLHPDNQETGDHNLFIELQQHADVLKKKFGL